MENNELITRINELEKQVLLLQDEKNEMQSMNLKDLQILVNSVIEIPDETIIFAVDKKLNFIAFNNNYLQHIKATIGKEITTGMNIVETLKNYTDTRNLELELKRALNSEEFFQVGDYLKNAQRYYYKDVYRPLYNNNNQIIGAIVYYIDITETTRSVKIWQILLDIYEIVHSVANINELVSFIHQQLTQIIDTTNFYVALYDEANDIYSFPFYVDKYDEISKIKPQSLKKSLTDYVRRKGKPLLLSEYIDNELIKNGEVEMVGTPSPSWLGVPLKTRDKTIGVMVVQNYKTKNVFTEKDVELLAFISEHIAIALERKKFEQELKSYAENLLIAKDKAEESDRLKSAFLANISHEIRTPLNAILGFSKLLAKHELSKNQRQEYFAYIENSGNNLLSLINDIIDVAKIEAGQILIKKSKCRVNKILDELLDNTNKQKALKEKDHLEIRLFKENQDPNFGIYTDCNRFKQIFTNLLSNSLKFTETGHIEFGYQYVDNNTIKFYVQDSGIGIPEDKHNIIFSRFGQILDSEVRNPGGTGLGLSISKHLIEEMGGKIWFKSEQKKGTTFFFTLPIISNEYENENAQKEETTEHKAEKMDFANLRILIAEDDAINTKLLLDTLNLYEPNIKIDTAQDGQIAIKMLENQEYDIIIMDIRMPNIDGNEATKFIRTKMPTPKNQIPIIGLSAHAIKDEVNKSLEAGMNVFLTKPLIDKEIIQHIYRLTKRNFKRDEEKNNNDHLILYNNYNIIDLSLLRQMYKNDKKKIDYILSLCQQNVPNQLIEMEKSFYKEKWDVLRTIAHTLKSTFNYIGAKELREIAKKIEEIATNKTNINELTEQISNLKSIWNLALTEINKEINNQ